MLIFNVLKTLLIVLFSACLTQPAQAQTALGERRVIAIVAHAPDMPAPDINRDALVTGVSIMSNYYQENSYGQFRLVPFTLNDIYPRGGGAYTLAPVYRCNTGEPNECDIHDANACPAACNENDPEDCISAECAFTCDPYESMRAVIAQADPDITFEDNDIVLVYLPFQHCGRKEDDGSWVKRRYHAMRLKDVATDDGTFVLGAAYFHSETSFVGVIDDYSDHVDTLAHETGHALGVGHANALACPSLDVSLDECRSSEYGDLYDVMGGDLGMGNDALPHSGPVFKERWGWMHTDPESPHRVIEVNVNNDGQTFYLNPIESQATGIKALKVPHDQDRYIYVHFRRPVGLDAGLPGQPTTTVFDGALLHLSTSGLGRAHLLLLGEPYNDSRLAALPFGQSWTDPDTGTVISIGQINAQGKLPVTVRLGQWDFNPPIINNFNISAPDDGCTATLTLTASDREAAAGDPYQGISRVIYHLSNSYRDRHEDVIQTQPPFRLDVDLNVFDRGYVWLEIFDNADPETPNVRQSPTYYIPAGGPACDHTPPRIIIHEPDLSKPLGNPGDRVLFDVEIIDENGIAPLSNVIYSYQDSNQNMAAVPIITIPELTDSFRVQKMVTLRDVVHNPSIEPPGRYIGHELTYYLLDVRGNLNYDNIYFAVGHACNDGIDNDNDGFVDYPADVNCKSTEDLSERGECADYLDNDIDGTSDITRLVGDREITGDKDCISTASSELNNESTCNDGIDNDGDGKTDYRIAGQGDPDCLTPYDQTEGMFIRGDANLDRQVNIADANFILSWLFLGAQKPGNLDAADVNDDGTINISDPIRLLQRLYLDHHRAIPRPYPDLGLDPTEDDL